MQYILYEIKCKISEIQNIFSEIECKISEI